MLKILSLSSLFISMFLYSSQAQAVSETITLQQYQQSSLDLLVSSEEISSKVQQVARQINQEYKDKQLSIVMILKGSVCVTADLIRYLEIPFQLETVKASSYGYNGMTGGKLTIEGLDLLEIKGRDILLIDDIFETGNTMLSLANLIQEKKPSSLKTLVLLLKDVPRTTSQTPDYVLFTIPNRFVIGYGLDYKELYRGLPGIYAFPNDTAPF